MTETPQPDQHPMASPEEPEGVVYASEDEDQLQPKDTLDDRGVDDVLDEGYTAPEGWSPATSRSAFGTTPEEAAEGETLDQRLAQEEPEPDPYDEAAEEAVAEHVEGEVGETRAGRLVADDQGLGPDETKELVADDVGIDGAAASAEEAAVHEIPDLDEPL